MYWMYHHYYKAPVRPFEVLKVFSSTNSIKKKFQAWIFDWHIIRKSMRKAAVSHSAPLPQPSSFPAYLCIFPAQQKGKRREKTMLIRKKNGSSSSEHPICCHRVRDITFYCCHQQVHAIRWQQNELWLPSDCFEQISDCWQVWDNRLWALASE